MDEYDVSGQPTRINAYSVGGDTNFLVDESSGRLYETGGAGNGVGVTEMSTNSVTAWSLSGASNDGSTAIAVLPSDLVYSASGDVIFEFTEGGVVVARYSAPEGVMAGSLMITPNGNLLYGNVTGDNTSALGIIGVSNLEIGNDSVVTQSPISTTAVDLNFTIGQMVADPVRDLVYVADLTEARVFAVNTDSGTEVASQLLPAEPGALAVSLDNHYLYVAESGAFQIQVLSLPDLTPVNALNVGMEVDSLVATVNDHMFISTPAESGNSSIDEIDARTGAVLGTLPTEYVSPVPRMNQAGTTLYVEGQDYPGGVDAYNVSGTGKPTKTTNYASVGGGTFFVNESTGRLYMPAGRGVGVTDLDTNATTSWFLGSPYRGSSAIAALPSGAVYVSSGNEIYAFDKEGNVLVQYALPNQVIGAALQITPNGNLLYSFVNGDTTSDLGIIGISNLVIANDRFDNPLPTATAEVNFTIGRMVADPLRDVVYVADLTNSRILAINTDSGRTVASQALAGGPGALAVSVGGDQLYVAEPAAFQIQVLALPDLNPITTLHVGIEVDNLIAVVNDHLFISTPGQFGINVVEELDARTGAGLSTLPTQHLAPLFRTNPAGTVLYIREDDEGSGADGSVDQYDVSGAGLPTKTTMYPAPSEENSQDFLVDESARRVYTLESASQGVGVTDMNTKGMTYWMFGVSPSGGQALAALPSSPLYAASSDEIYEFGAGGVILAQYADSNGVMAESLKITPNGHLLYGQVNDDNTSVLGIIGASSLVIDDVPTANFTVSAGSNGRMTFDARNSLPGTGKKHETITTCCWNFGDGTTGNGMTITHKFTGAGPFTVTLTVTNSSGQTGTFSVAVLGGAISGTVYNDTNANGSRGSKEPGLANWPVYLDAEVNGQLVPDVASTLSAANGSYTFTGLTIGTTYIVHEMIDSQWLATTPTRMEVPIKSKQTVTGQNFGNALFPIISGKVFDQLSTGNLPLKGWLVYLYATKNGKIIPSSGILAITAADGSYAFTGLKPGVTYQVSIVAPIGWVATTPTQIDVTAVADTNKTANDFGFAVAASSHGNVFYAGISKDDGEEFAL